MTLVGPLFWHDLTRMARKHNLALLRAAYALVLLFILFLGYRSQLPAGTLFGGTAKPAHLRQLAEGYFLAFMAVQMALVVLLTPLHASTALAEEKARNTLLFLLTTQLTAHEIVLSKLGTRVLFIAGLLLTGLPILAVLQLLGGVDFRLVLAGFLMLGLTLLSLGAVGMACGALTRKPDDAPWRAYQCVVAYTALSFVLVWACDLPAIGRPAMATRVTGVVGPPRWVYRTATPTATEWLAEGACSGNPLYIARQIMEHTGDDRFEPTLLRLLGQYAAFHGLLGLAALLVALVGLRYAVATQIAGLAPRKKVILKPTPHPPIRDRPVLWKELHCDSRPRRRWLTWFFGSWFYWCSFLPGFLLMQYLIEFSYDRLVQYLEAVLQFGSVLAVSGICLRVGVQAARSLAGERERGTLDCLVLTRVSLVRIFFEKWLGAVLVGRWLLVWLAVHWAYCVLAMALHPVAYGLLIAQTAVFAVFAVALGLWCGMRYRTTRGATAAVVLIGFLSTVLFPLCFYGVVIQAFPPAARWMWATRGFEWQRGVGIGLTPGWLVMETADRPWIDTPGRWYRRHGAKEAEELGVGVLLAFGVFPAASLLLTTAALRRFLETLPPDERPLPLAADEPRWEPVDKLNTSSKLGS